MLHILDLIVRGRRLDTHGSTSKKIIIAKVCREHGTQEEKDIYHDEDPTTL